MSKGITGDGPPAIGMLVIQTSLDLEASLQLLHGDNVRRLDVVLDVLDLLLQLVERDLLILNDQVDLELLDTETNSNELGGTPNETILLNGTNRLLECLHVGLIVCTDVLAKA